MRIDEKIKPRVGNSDSIDDEERKFFDSILHLNGRKKDWINFIESDS